MKKLLFIVLFASALLSHATAQEDSTQIANRFLEQAKGCYFFDEYRTAHQFCIMALDYNPNLKEAAKLAEKALAACCYSIDFVATGNAPKGFDKMLKNEFDQQLAARKFYYAVPAPNKKKASMRVEVKLEYDLDTTTEKTVEQGFCCSDDTTCARIEYTNCHKSYSMFCASRYHVTDLRTQASRDEIYTAARNDYRRYVTSECTDSLFQGVWHPTTDSLDVVLRVEPARSQFVKLIKADRDFTLSDDDNLLSMAKEIARGIIDRLATLYTFR